MCGGLMWLLFGVYKATLLASAEFGLPISSVFFAVALFLSVTLGESHAIATHVRLYENADSMRKHRTFLILGPVFIGVAILALCTSSVVLSVVSTIYVLATIHHGLRQCYGLSLLYCRKQNYKLNFHDRKLLSLLLHAVAVFAMLRPFTYPEFSKSPLPGVELAFVQIVPPWVIYSAIVVLVSLGLLAAVRFLLRAARLGQFFPLSSAALLINGSLVVIFSREIAGDLWIFVPGFFHGSQYLVTSLMHRIGSQRLAGRLKTENIMSSVCLYFLGLVTVSTLIYGGLPALLKCFGVNSNVAYASVFLGMFFHHFYADSLIWRLRDFSVTKPLDA